MDVLSWEGLATCYEPGVVADIRISCLGGCSEKELSGMSMGIRSFLTWLQRRSGKDAVFVRSLFNGAAEPTSTALARVHQLAKKWVSALEVGGKLSPGSITHYARRLRWALRLLGERFPKRFPTVPKGFLKRKEHVSGNHESLGDQDWPELEGLTGAARERAALNTVRREALAHFEELEKLFWFGQDLISSETPPDSIGDPNAWIAVKGRIQNALDTGSNRRERSGLGSGSISDPQVWRLRHRMEPTTYFRHRARSLFA